MSASDVPRTPWLEQLDRLVHDRPPRPLTQDVDVDVVVVGAGIAGTATAFQVLTHTSARVLLVERDRVGHGATGRNAGQLVTYTERPLCEIAREHGEARAVDAQRELETAWDLLAEMVEAAGADVRVDRFTGHMGMFGLDQVRVHLRNGDIRRRHGLAPEHCVVSDRAPFLDVLAHEHPDAFEVVPQAEVAARLDTDDARYCAVLSHDKGCANGALLCQQVIDHLLASCPDRFGVADHTPVERIVLERDRVEVLAGDHRVRARHAVLCTNGFVDHVVDNRAGPPVDIATRDRIIGTVGYMAGIVDDVVPDAAAISFVRNQAIGDDLVPYVYVTRRAFDRSGATVGLTCVGGPEASIDELDGYDHGDPFPAAVYQQIDHEVRELALPHRPAGRPYDYTWHGLMGYTPSGLRIVGAEPRNPALLYNLGCNGVGFLPSVSGARRIARLVAGEQLAPSLFDPT